MFKQVIAKIFGDVPHDTTDSGNPVKIGFQARTTNPTAVANADRVTGIADDVGRQVTWPYQVRDLISTGRAVLTRAQETSVIAGVASAFVDVVTITGANTSGVAQTVDVRVGTGSNIIDTLVVPATSVVSKTYHVPLIANENAAAWTAQNSTGGEISDSPVTITMVGVQNV